MIARRLAATFVSTAIFFGGAVAASTVANAESLPAPVLGNSALFSPQVTTSTEAVVQKFSPEFTAHLASLPAEQRKAILNQMPKTMTYTGTLTRVPQSASAPLSILATSCWTYRKSGDARGGLNNVLYTFYHVARWCASGGTVVGTDIVDYGYSINGTGWRYGGHTASDAGVINNEARSYSQFTFTFGAGGWDAIVETPCLRVFGHANGGVNSDNTCGVY